MCLDEDAVICDFAETYHIYDIYQYPCEYIATLAAGLRETSRIRIKQAGLRGDPELFAMCACADSLRTLVWHNTENGHKGIDPPKPVLQFLRENTENTTSRGYSSGEDFQAEWSRLSGMEAE